MLDDKELQIQECTVQDVIASDAISEEKAQERCMHQDSRIKKAQELKTKTFVNSDIKDTSSETKIRGRLIESFQDDAKYEHVGTKTQDHKMEKTIKTFKEKDLKISDVKT
nr:hypothetical protein [Tanacetum cinerariifolium]